MSKGFSLSELAFRIQRGIVSIPSWWRGFSFRRDLNTDLTTRTYHPEDIQRVRSALKLSTKFLDKLPINLKNTFYHPISYLSEAAVLSILSGYEPLEITLAVSYVPFAVLESAIEDPKKKEEIQKKFLIALEKKFKKGQLPNLTPLIEDMLGKPPSEWHTLSSSETLQKVLAVISFIAYESERLHEKMNTVLLPEELRDPKLIKLIKEENKSSLVSQLFSVIEEESAEEGLEKEVEKKSVNPNVLIFEAARLAHIAFSGGVRKWGHKEEMPLPWHTSEVGIILLMSGADMPLVYAGFLHDFLEEYPQFRKGLTSGIESEEELKNNKELCSCLTNTFNRIRELVGNEAIVLVWHATEDGRGEGEKTLSWLNRKWSVMERLQNRSFEDKFRKHLAALICASKCSTLAALNKGLYIALKELEHNRDNLDTSALDFLKEKFSSLSKGSLLSNIAHFAWLKGIFEELEVPEPLLQLYEREFERHFMGLATRYLKENEQQGNEAVLSDPDLEKLLSINPNEAATLLESELARVSQRAEEIFQKRR